MVPHGRTNAYYYSPRNELTKYSDPEGSGRYYIFQYDMRRNLTKKYHTYYGSSWYTYDWDSQDRLTKVVNNAAGKTVDYRYDLLGRRAARRVNGGDWRWYFYDGLKMIAEGTGQNDRMFYTLSRAVIGGIISREDGTTTYTFHSDRLNNLVDATDISGVWAGDEHTWCVVAC